MTGWNFRRGLYVVLGSLVMIQSVIAREWAGVGLGAYFASMGVFAFGCAGGNCFGGSCAVNTPAGKGKQE